MKAVRFLTTLTAVVLFALLPVSLFAAPKKAGPIVVTINDVPNGAPVIQVDGAPNGYDVYTGADVATPGIEDGALITLFGVDTGGSIPDWGGRFVDPRPWESLPAISFPPDPVNYRQYVTALDIVWVEHDLIFDEDSGEIVGGTGNLRVGFNSALPGTWYINPDLKGDDNLGPVTDNWVTVYAGDTLVIRFKPHTYRLHAQVERPLKTAGHVSAVVQLDGSFAFDNSSGCSVGVSSHGGRFTAAASGNAFTGVWILTSTSANGDQLSGYHVMGSFPEEFRFTSGTGRFAGVSGGFTYVTSDVSMVPNPDDPTGMTVILSYNYSGTGTISY